MHDEYTHYALLRTDAQRTFAAVATTGTFAGVFALVALLPAIVLAAGPVADTDFMGLQAAVDSDDAVARAQCLRVARRSDYTVAFVGIGAPVQHLQLLLRLDEIVASPSEALYLFSNRMLKSQTIEREPASADSTLVATCRDALVYDGAHEQRHAQTHHLQTPRWPSRGTRARTSCGWTASCGCRSVTRTG